MRKKPGIKLKKTANVLLTYAIMLLVSIIFVFPIIWVVLSCFSASGSIYSFNGFFPSEYSFDSFKALFCGHRYVRLSEVVCKYFACGDDK